jgi:hypothetical protein
VCVLCEFYRALIWLGSLLGRESRQKALVGAGTLGLRLACHDTPGQEGRDRGRGLLSGTGPLKNTWIKSINDFLILAGPMTARKDILQSGFFFFFFFF